MHIYRHLGHSLCVDKTGLRTAFPSRWADGPSDTPCLWMDPRLHLRDIHVAMWIRPNRSLLARMPSMRPPPSAPAPGSVADMKQRKAPQPTLPPPLSEVEEAELAGGFHESSYELRTGMDIVEADWPDDVTIPGALGKR